MKISIKHFSKIVNFVMVAVVLSLVGVGFAFSSVPVSGELSPVYKGANEKKVSLMVNVYWGTEYIDGMLDVFDAHEVKTTFFVGGSWVRDNEAVFLKIIERGHEIGNHGFFHKDHDKISLERNREEISATHELVKAVCGLEMELFAPPSGAFNQNTLDIAKNLGYTTIMWSKDTIDWRDKDAELIYKRAVKNISGGDLVLMHPTEKTLQALDRIITEIKKNNLTVAPVSEVLNAE